MYKKADEWLRVLRLVSVSSNATDDKQRIEALTNVANYNKDRQRWKEAANHYELAGKLKELMECYIHLDDFYGLENLAKQLPDSHPLLPQVAELFASSGLCDNAVQCFLRCGQISDALDTCIQLNNWDKAVALSRTHNLRNVDILMGKYVEELSESSERSLAAVQLYRRAGRFLDGARVVYMVARDFCLPFSMAEDERSKASNCLRLKKMYVLAAMLIEEYHAYNKERLAKKRGEQGNDGLRSSRFSSKCSHSMRICVAQTMTVSDELNTRTITEFQISVVVNELLEGDKNLSLEDSRMIDRTWTAALAYHFMMLAHRQLFAGRSNVSDIFAGDHSGAMKTSLHLTQFEAYIDPIEIHSLLALSSCACRQFTVCSRAFMRLESLTDPASEERRAYQKLALELFTSYPPTDSHTNMVTCITCNKPVADYEFCCPRCETKVSLSYFYSWRENYAKSQFGTGHHIRPPCPHNPTYFQAIGRLCAVVGGATAAHT
uniref:TPR_REGION domain-containing protein n=1 Tax=Angiostrongylus cantonensis TaxID=6313 RepID=A0A0K0CW25_ANGCA